MLEKIINFEHNYKPLINEISFYEWDYEDKPFILQKKHLKNALTKYTRLELTSEDIFGWANFLELRGDVDYDNEDQIILSEIIHELANPDIEGALNLNRGNILLKKL